MQGTFLSFLLFGSMPGAKEKKTCFKGIVKRRKRKERKQGTPMKRRKGRGFVFLVSRLCSLNTVIYSLLLLLLFSVCIFPCVGEMSKGNKGNGGKGREKGCTTHVIILQLTFLRKTKKVSGARENEGKVQTHTEKKRLHG